MCINICVMEHKKWWLIWLKVFSPTMCFCVDFVVYIWQQFSTRKVERQNDFNWSSQVMFLFGCGEKFQKRCWSLFLLTLSERSRSSKIFEMLLDWSSVRNHAFHSDWHENTHCKVLAAFRQILDHVKHSIMVDWARPMWTTPWWRRTLQFREPRRRFRQLHSLLTPQQVCMCWGTKNGGIIFEQHVLCPCCRNQLYCTIIISAAAVYISTSSHSFENTELSSQVK